MYFSRDYYWWYQNSFGKHLRIEWCSPTSCFHQGRFKRFLIPYANDNLVLGRDFNCTVSTLDKKGGRPIDSKKASLKKLQLLSKTQNLLESWRFKNPDQPGFTWANPSMKIQCRLILYFKAAKRSRKGVQNTSKHLFRSLRRRFLLVFKRKWAPLRTRVLEV